MRPWERGHICKTWSMEKSKTCFKCKEELVVGDRCEKKGRVYKEDGYSRNNSIKERMKMKKLR